MCQIKLEFSGFLKEYVSRWEQEAAYLLLRLLDYAIKGMDIGHIKNNILDQDSKK